MHVLQRRLLLAFSNTVINVVNIYIARKVKETANEQIVFESSGEAEFKKLRLSTKKIFLKMSIRLITQVIICRPDLSGRIK